MNWLEELTEQVEYLLGVSNHLCEECSRITIAGESIDPEIIEVFKTLFNILSEKNLPAPTIITNSDQLNAEDLNDANVYLGDDWRVIIGKSGLQDLLKARDIESTVVFFSQDEFSKWLDTLDPLENTKTNAPDFSGPVTFRINGLAESFGGSMLWVLPFQGMPYGINESSLPCSSDVHSLIHIVASKVITISPRSFDLSWGEVGSDLGLKLLRISAPLLASCLVQEVKLVDNSYEVTLNGTKRLVLPLYVGEEQIDTEFIKLLSKAVTWVYSERAETRLKLIMDRLSIDIPADTSLVSGMQKFLEAALQQAKDSYAFVILERKDAYHKEMRELMKDMKSQSEIYSSKVRDLVSALTRDMLGVLVFIGFSFIGKFDKSKIQSLLASDELSLLLKFLVLYLILSCSLQIITHWRDAKLTFIESEKWLSVLQNYTSLEDSRERFIRPIEARKTTLWLAMWVSAVFYLLLSFLMWNLPFVITLLLNQ